jgi:hypothetical protein
MHSFKYTFNHLENLLDFLITFLNLTILTLRLFDSTFHKKLPSQVLNLFNNLIMLYLVPRKVYKFYSY